MNYLIIGNSAAAVGCVEGIRQIDQSSPITLLSSEPEFTYSRPLISYLLLGKTEEKHMRYRGDHFYEEMGCRFVPGTTVTSIDPVAKTVHTAQGTDYSYDRLLTATGSSPFVPPLEGLEKVKNQFCFYTLDDARKLAKACTPNSRVLILGAGLIGLKCAEGIKNLVAHITVVDLASHILPSIMDESAAQMVQKRLEENDIELVLSDSVSHFEANAAFLSSGKKLNFDLLVVAVGVRPNTSLIANAGGKVEKGVCIDTHGRTSLTDIYAAGDCTVSHDISSGQDRVLALLPNAYLQGECAGVCMAGGSKQYDKAIPMNSIGFFGLHVASAGTLKGEVLAEERRENCYKKLVAQNGVLKGFLLVGEVNRAGIYTSLIRNQTPLEQLDMAYLKEKPQLLAFLPKERSKLLGGVPK